MAAWAEAGAGRYFDAAGATELADAIVAAVSAPYRVYVAGASEPIASGTVGGAAIQLEPGDYDIEVLTDPISEFKNVSLGGGEARSLLLASAPEP